MDWQNVINFAGAALLAAIGWWCREIWDSVKKLKEDIKDIEVNLPTNYVRKDDMEARFDRLETALDRIFEKLDAKADK